MSTYINTLTIRYHTDDSSYNQRSNRQADDSLVIVVEDEVCFVKEQCNTGVVLFVLSCRSIFGFICSCDDGVYFLSREFSLKESVNPFHIDNFIYNSDARVVLFM